MKKMSHYGESLPALSDCDHRLAVLDLGSGEVLDCDSSVDLVRGQWNGKDALAVVAKPESLSSRKSHEDDLRALHEISFELSLCPDPNELCREAVRLGRAKLDFDRLGVWLIDQKSPKWKQGTWGTDEFGEMRDEGSWRQERKTGDFPESFGEGRLPYVFQENVPCRDEDRELGRANKIVAPLWDGHSLIGEIGADDLLLHRGFSLEKREIFVILARIVAHLVGLKRAESDLRQLASTDPLTGTVNRRTALIILEKHLGQSRRSGSPLTICLADLDGLKLVNDAFGHAAGDRYICSASSALVRAVRSSDTVGRIGGDEFLILFPDCPGGLVSGIMDRVNAELASAQWRSGYIPRLSWGIASTNEIGKGGWSEKMSPQRCIDMLLELADQRMYDNKRAKGAARASSSSPAENAL